MPTKHINGVYYIDTEINGIRVRKSLKTKNKVEADKRERKILDPLITQALQREVGIEPEPIAIGVAPRLKTFYTDTFIPWAEDEYKKRQRTLRAIKERMALVLTFDELANARLDNISERTLDRFKASLTTRNYAGRTINHAMGVIRRVLRVGRRWSKSAGYRVHLPEFPSRADEKKHTRVVTAEEEGLYVGKCPTHLHRVFFKLLIDTGMEPGAAAQARWEHVHFDGNENYPNGWIYDPQEKTEYRQRDIPLTLQVRQTLREWWLEQGRPASGWLFPSDIKEGDHRPLWSFHTTHKRIFGKGLRQDRGKGKRKFPHRQKEYGLKLPNGDRVPYFRLYDLRHTFLTRLGEEGVSEIELMHIAGWSTTRMASTYVHPSKRRLSRAIEKLDRAVAAD